jgi:hypothetical protein
MDIDPINFEVNLPDIKAGKYLVTMKRVEPLPTVRGLLLSGECFFHTLMIGDDPGEHGMHLVHEDDAPHAGRFWPEPTITRVRDGQWHDPEIWDKKRVPTLSDSVLAPGNVENKDGVRCYGYQVLLTKNGSLHITQSALFHFLDLPFIPIDTMQWGHGLICDDGRLLLDGDWKRPLLNRLKDGKKATR